ncbi:protein-tyrosine phosphatase family protein [Desulfonema magnum]|uniref:Phosphatase catalytoc domain-containing protein n=1 Tax=Desulfonema magnum TaxID=45655 RepID=A0A975BI78_9BACT|nr:dual specificity protein phosphatase family protein [Desulfonema magnum]QTA85788.1 Phosphatase catalytoc domain-containing protein [Desulfonema magnum]
MKKQQDVPLYDSYWVIPGKVLAGEYPPQSMKKCRAMLRCLLENSITFFMNFTEKGEKRLKSYETLLHEEADALRVSVEHHRIPIQDFKTAEPEKIRQIINLIDSALAKGHKVYIHCFAGVGRTGMIAGCYLVQHGLSSGEALSRLDHLKQGTGYERETIPHTLKQRRVVQNWSATI